MQPPLTKLEQATIVRAYHTADQDTLRLQFDGSAELIAYNDSSLDDHRLSIADPSREFPTISGLRVEMIARTAEELIFRLSAGRVIRIGLREEDSHGPEAFQVVLPGYPPIVEQNV
jgi:hypothetical protein